MKTREESKKIILIGAGGRGKTYTDIAGNMDGEFEVVAVADPADVRRHYIQDKHNLPDEMCQKSWETLLEKPKFADVVIIANMDRGHFAPAMAAIEKGYDILLEKPMAPTPEECVAIRNAAKEKGVFVLVCHVLRFTQFFKSLKRIIDEGTIGDIVHIQHAECVGNVHQSHSFVRGNWGNSDASSCMILQKSCHDMDILQWLIGKPCRRVHSFGGLYYFKRENAPAGAPERCIDGCPVGDSCPYNAVKLYLNDKKNSWFRNASTHKTSPTDRDVENVLRTTQYGKCVFKCDNNVVDHEAVNLEFAGGVTVSFTMCAFNKGSRNIRIMGTKGELFGNMGDPFVSIYDFATRETRQIQISDVMQDQSIVGGHGGGDTGIMQALAKRLNGDTSDTSICTIDETCANHMIAFAAEESRVTGKVIDLAEYEAAHSV